MADVQQDYQYVKLPDGSYGKFLSNASDADIRGAISKDFPDAFKPKIPTANDLAQIKANADTSQQKIDQMGSTSAIKNSLPFLKSVGMGLLNPDNGFQNASDFTSDMGNAVKGVAQLAAPPQTTGEKATSILAPGSLPLIRAIKGYVGAVQHKNEMANKSEDNGDITGAVINRSAALLPLLGPLVPDVDNTQPPPSVGTGLSRIVQASAASPGETVPNVVVDSLPLLKSLVGETNNLRRAAMDRIFVEGTPQELMVKGIRPPVTTPELETALNDRMGQVFQKGEATGKPVNNLKNYLDAVKGAKQDAAQAYDQVLQPNRAGVITTTPTKVAIMQSTPDTEALVNPRSIAKNAQIANQFPDNMTVDAADRLRVDSNNRLEDFYNRSAGNRNAALSQPDTARTAAINTSIRNLLYNELKQRTGINPEPIQNAYGQLDEIQNATEKRGVVYGRQSPVSIAENLAVAEKGIKAFVTSKLLKTYNNPSTIVRIAYERWAAKNGIKPSWLTTKPSTAAPVVRATGAISATQQKQ